MIGLILFTVYFLSVILWWKYINIAHSKSGIYSHSSPSKDALTIMFFPILNTFFSVFGWLLFYPIKKESDKKDFSRFFKIKK